MDDVERIVRRLAADPTSPLRDGVGPVSAGVAPGRIDVLGGEVAFAGAFIAAQPTAETAIVAIRRGEDGRILLQSDTIVAEGLQPRIGVHPTSLPLRYEADLIEALSADAKSRWIAPLVALVRRMVAPGAMPGLRIVVHSTIPRREGLASSTAVLVAAARALTGVLDRGWADDEIVDAVLEIERFQRPTIDRAVVRAVASFRDDKILPILPQPDTTYEPADLPAPLEVWYLQTPSPVAADRSSSRLIRVATGMAYRMIVSRMGLTVRTGERGEPQQVEDPYFQGYFANVDPITYAAEFRDHLPRELRGEEFLDAWGGLADPAVRVDPALMYPVRRAATLVVAENQRACSFVDDLHRTAPPGDVGVAASLGAALTASYRDLHEFGHVPREVDHLVRELLRRGATAGVLGARAAMGNGTVVALVRPSDEAERAVAAAVAAFEREFGRTAALHRAPRRAVPSPAQFSI